VRTAPETRNGVTERQDTFSSFHRQQWMGTRRKVGGKLAFTL